MWNYLFKYKQAMVCVDVQLGEGFFEQGSLVYQGYQTIFGPAHKFVGIFLDCNKHIYPLTSSNSFSDH